MGRHGARSASVGASAGGGGGGGAGPSGGGFGSFNHPAAGGDRMGGMPLQGLGGPGGGVIYSMMPSAHQFGGPTGGGMLGGQPTMLLNPAGMGPGGAMIGQQMVGQQMVGQQMVGQQMVGQQMVGQQMMGPPGLLQAAGGMGVVAGPVAGVEGGMVVGSYLAAGSGQVREDY